MPATQTPNHYTGFTQALQTAEAAGYDQDAAQKAVLAAAAHLAMATAQVVIGQAEGRTEMPSSRDLWLNSMLTGRAKYTAGDDRTPFNAVVELQHIRRRNRKHYHPTLLIGGKWALKSLHISHDPDRGEMSVGSSTESIQAESLAGVLSIVAERIKSIAERRAEREAGVTVPDSTIYNAFDSSEDYIDYVDARRNTIALEGIRDTLVYALDSGLKCNNFSHSDIAQAALDQLRPAEVAN